MAKSPARADEPGMLASLEPMLEDRLAVSPPDSGWAERRREAFARFRDGGLPSTREEDWKYTSLRQIERRGFLPAQPPDAGSMPDIAGALVPGLEAWRIVFVDGFFAEALSDLPEGTGCRSLGDLIPGQDLPEGLGDLVDEGHHRLAALNTALFQDGLVLEVPAGRTLERPLYVVWAQSTADGGPRLSCPRLYLELGRDARATVIEHFIGQGMSQGMSHGISEDADPGGRDDLVLGVTEARLAAGSRLAHYRLQQAARNGFVISGLHADVGAGARLASHDVDTGARLSRHDIHVRLSEPESEVSLKGLYVGAGRQHMDTHTRVDHLVPHTRSEETYKGVLSGKARSVFNGKVHIHRDAQKSEAFQANHNLLLSEQAEADTKPELEIYADDVRASHGATVGQLDEEALFYLLSRGLEPETAQEILVFAFADEVLAEMALEPVRRHLERAVMAQLPDSGRVSELVGEVA